MGFSLIVPLFIRPGELHENDSLRLKNKYLFFFFLFHSAGDQTRASCGLAKCSTGELHPWPKSDLLNSLVSWCSVQEGSHWNRLSLRGVPLLSDSYWKVQFQGSPEKTRHLCSKALLVKWVDFQIMSHPQLFPEAGKKSPFEKGYLFSVCLSHFFFQVSRPL